MMARYTVSICASYTIDNANDEFEAEDTALASFEEDVALYAKNEARFKDIFAVHTEETETNNDIQTK